MTDWDQLREVGHEVSPPPYASLVATAARRNRRARGLAVGATLLVLLGAGVGLKTLDERAEGDLAPADEPSGPVVPTDNGDLPDGVSALPGPDPGSDHATLGVGRYRVPLDDNLSFEVDVPSKSYAHDDGIFIATGAVVLKVAIADDDYGVPLDPCTAQFLVPAGAGVEDLVQAIGSREVYNASRPTSARIGGATGTYLEIDIPRTFNTSDCAGGEIQSPGTPLISVGWAPPARGRYWILDVDGQRIVVAQECSCSADEFDRATPIAESITFTATP